MHTAETLEMGDVTRSRRARATSYLPASFDEESDELEPEPTAPEPEQPSDEWTDAAAQVQEGHNGRTTAELCPNCRCNPLRPRLLDILS